MQLGRGIWIDGWIKISKRDKVLFTYGRKTTIRAVYQQLGICMLQMLVTILTAGVV